MGRTDVPPAARPYLLASILVAVVLTLLLGVFPAGPMEMARAAVVSIR